MRERVPHSHMYPYCGSAVEVVWTSGSRYVNTARVQSASLPPGTRVRRCRARLAKMEHSGRVYCVVEYRRIVWRDRGRLGLVHQNLDFDEAHRRAAELRLANPDHQYAILEQTGRMIEQ